MALIKWNRGTNPHFSLGEWETSSIWWKQDKCLECHKPVEEVKNAATESTKGSPTSPPRYHLVASWESRHGRIKAAKRTACYSCHQISSCDTCHGIAPKTHSIGFSKPDGMSMGTQLHAILGRLRPSSCVLCHRNLLADCGDCHSTEEITSLQNQGLKQLKEWPQIYETFKVKAL